MPTDRIGVISPIMARAASGSCRYLRTRQSTPAGQTIVVDARGKKTTYDFDTSFRTTSVTNDDGCVTAFTYDDTDHDRSGPRRMHP